MKLSIYPKLVDDACKRNKLKRIEFEILLWAADQDWFCVYDIYENVPGAKVTSQNAIKRLCDIGLLKMARTYYGHGMSRRYVITPSSRMIVHHFYTKFKFLQPK